MANVKRGPKLKKDIERMTKGQIKPTATKKKMVNKKKTAKKKKRIY